MPEAWNTIMQGLIFLLVFGIAIYSVNNTNKNPFMKDHQKDADTQSIETVSGLYNPKYDTSKYDDRECNNSNQKCKFNEICNYWKECTIWSQGKKCCKKREPGDPTCDCSTIAGNYEAIYSNGYKMKICIYDSCKYEESYKGPTDSFDCKTGLGHNQYTLTKKEGDISQCAFTTTNSWTFSADANNQWLQLKNDKNEYISTFIPSA